MQSVSYTTVHLKDGRTVYTSEDRSSVENRIFFGFEGDDKTSVIIGVDGETYTIRNVDVGMVSTSTPESRQKLYELQALLEVERAQAVQACQRQMMEEMNARIQKEAAPPPTDPGMGEDGVVSIHRTGPKLNVEDEE